MGKYMRKSKTTTGEVALLEVSSNKQSSSSSASTLGVRTRAKTLALQKSSSTASDGGGDGGGSYLQLRSRRLEKLKPLVGFEGKRQKHPHPPLKDHLNLPKKKNQKEREMQGHSWNSGFVDGDEKKEEINNNSGGGGVEASFGENLLEFDSRERTTRESTPCSLIRDPDNIQKPPGSSTKPNNASEANGGVPNSAQRNIPTTREMNDFFAGPEEREQRQFIEKYNFDPVNDKPLPGRYEWVKLDR